MTLLTPEQVAAVLRTTPRAIKDILRAGELKGSKVGRFWRIQPEDLRDYIQGDVRGIFCRIIGGDYGKSWVSDKKSRDYVRKIAGRLCASTDDLPFDIQDELSYLIKSVPKEKETRCSTYGQASRALLDLIDTTDPAPPR